MAAPETLHLQHVLVSVCLFYPTVCSLTLVRIATLLQHMTSTLRSLGKASIKPPSAGSAMASGALPLVGAIALGPLGLLAGAIAAGGMGEWISHYTLVQYDNSISANNSVSMLQQAWMSGSEWLCHGRLAIPAASCVVAGDHVR